MGLDRYGVLRGRVVDARRGDAGAPHYQVHVRAAGVDYRVAVNTVSELGPSRLLFRVEERFRHGVTAELAALGDGFTPLARRPGTAALDYVRGGMLARADMRSLPPSLPGPGNDLGDLVARHVERARHEAGAALHAFGDRWGPEPDRPDRVFGFRPGNGVHNIHMNQGNHPRFVADDGVWQDGALIFHFPASRQWVAVFLAFQSQSWRTDDRTGHALPAGRSGRGDPRARIG